MHTHVHTDDKYVQMAALYDANRALFALGKDAVFAEGEDSLHPVREHTHNITRHVCKPTRTHTHTSYNARTTMCTTMPLAADEFHGRT